mmetsp:Transcript_39732/g.84809  ORF Transcript_39732/g.84809 Transcript_39732/m.84809 type:complete len:576 (-) Transcript_39732:122-1849(-)
MDGPGSAVQTLPGGRPGRTASEGKPRLPRLRANVNPRAQQIIKAHMHTASTQASFSSTATVPLLTQIESTAPRTARTHDISHLCDRSGYLKPVIPPSLVAESDHVYESGFLPKDSSSVYDDRDGLWHTRVFPSAVPSSRTDAILLDSWITRTLERHSELGVGAAKEELARALEDLVPILSTALHEIVRQVTHHCAERGIALEKIWRTYVELFDRVLHQLQDALRVQKRRTTEALGVLEKERQALQDVRDQHPQAMHKAIADLEAQFTSRQQEAETALKEVGEANAELKQELRLQHHELDVWVPGFHLYRDSYIRGHIPTTSRPKLQVRQSPEAEQPPKEPADGESPAGKAAGAAEAGAEEEEVAPEVAIAEDFKRLLAVLAPEKRTLIGKELAFIMEAGPDVAPKAKANGRRPSKTEKKPEAEKEEQDAKEALRAEIHAQEERIRAMKAEVHRLEVLQAAPPEARGGVQKRKQVATPPLEEEGAEGQGTEAPPNKMSLAGQDMDALVLQAANKAKTEEGFDKESEDNELGQTDSEASDDVEEDPPKDGPIAPIVEQGGDGGTEEDQSSSSASAGE